MKHRALFFAAVLLGGCASAPPPAVSRSAALLAAAFEAAPGPYSFDCDVPAGTYSERNAHVPGGTFTVNGAVQFIGLQTDARYAPMAAIELSGVSEQSSVGFVVFVNPNEPGKFQVGLRNAIGGRRKPAVFATVPFTNAAIPFAMALDKPGSLVVTVGDFTKTVSLPKSTFTRTRMICSTGHVQFSNVVVTASSQ